MFDILSDRLDKVFTSLRGKGRLSDADIDATRTLGAGTCTVGARTPNDQCNLGTISPTRQVLVR